MRRLTSLAIAFSLALPALAGCGEPRALREGPEYEPIVPGYSIAGVDIGSDYSRLRQAAGEPYDAQQREGYLILFYQPTDRYEFTAPADNRPGAWHMVATLYHASDDPEPLDTDKLASLELSAPYYGTTAAGNGLGSTREQIEAEFGTAESASDVIVDEPPLTITCLSYPTRGVQVLLEPETGALTYVVTEMGGLKPVVIEDEERDRQPQGTVFGEQLAAAILPGAQLSGIGVGMPWQQVKAIFGPPDATGATTEGAVTAAYTGGYGNWKLCVHFEDLEKNRELTDFDPVVAICVTAPYAGTTKRGNGIGSTAASWKKEFGTPDMQQRTSIMGQDAQIWYYLSQGLVVAMETTGMTAIEVDVIKVP
ncbi:MAG: hypothetical protein ACYC55_02360 [Candidatus Geothermincolia bacterium]